MIELLMTLLIIGILSAVAYSRFNPAIFGLRSATDDLMSALRYTQQRAMSHAGLSSYALTLSNHCYVITRDGVPESDPITGQGDFQQTWPDITISPATQITFDGQGDPGLTVPLTIDLTMGSESSQLTVERITGFVH